MALDQETKATMRDAIEEQSRIDDQAYIEECITKIVAIVLEHVSVDTIRLLVDAEAVRTGNAPNVNEIILREFRHVLDGIRVPEKP